MIDAITIDESLPTISIIEAMQMLILTYNDVPTTTVQKCFKKANFLMRKKIFYLKTFHKIASFLRCNFCS